jgi:hypothetical protein
MSAYLDVVGTSGVFIGRQPRFIGSFAIQHGTDCCEQSTQLFDRFLIRIIDITDQFSRNIVHNYRQKKKKQVNQHIISILRHT